MWTYTPIQFRIPIVDQTIEKKKVLYIRLSILDKICTQAKQGVKD